MTDLFASPRLKISGANEEIEELGTLILAYLREGSFTVVAEDDPDGIHVVHKIKVVKPTPARFGLLTARIASELRDALDQAGYASAIAAGKIKPKKTYFPICQELDNFENTIKQNCKHLPEEIVTLFRSFQAHPGGDEMLVALNNIAGGGKHCVIDPVANTVGGTYFKSVRPIGVVPRLQMLYPRWDHLKQEAKVIRFTKGARVNYEVSASTHVVFGDIPIVGRQPVGSTLVAMSQKVDGIVSATEAELRRIGLIT